MKITREIDGVTHTIELTRRELYDAYSEQEHLFDIESIENSFDAYDDDEIKESFGMSRKCLEQLFPEMAYQLRRNIDKYTLTIQGEFCAPGIQQNRLRLIRPEWYVFTIRENGKRVGLERMLTICEALGIEHVPVEEVGEDLPGKYPTVEALLERADGNYPKGGKKEGIVIRPVEPVYNPIIGGPLSMKVVSNKYLLKTGG